MTSPMSAMSALFVSLPEHGVGAKSGGQQNYRFTSGPHVEARYASVLALSCAWYSSLFEHAGDAEENLISL